MFGTSEAINVVVNSATSITATAPVGSGTVNVTVTTSQGTSSDNSADLYTYEAPPTVSGVSPNSGTLTGGTTVTLSGTGFASDMPVDFGANAASSVTVNSSTSATVVSPQGSSNNGGVVDVTVTTTNGTSPINGGDQNNMVEKVTPAGQLAIFAGGGSTPISTTPQAATSAALNGPTGMVMDGWENFYISDQNISVIEKVNSSGQIPVTVTEVPLAPLGGLMEVSCGLLPPTPVPVDSKENVFFTDGAGNGLVEVVYNTTGTSANAILTAEGYTSLKQGYAYIVAGGQSATTYPYDNDGGSSVAYNGSTSTANTALNNPSGIYGDSAGDLIFADNSSNKIKKLSGTTAVLSTIGGPAAGTATTVGHSGDGGPATSAQMNAPIGVILDASGNVYFADSGNSSVRMIGTNGNISTVAGTSGTSGTYTGEGGRATSAVMNTTYFLSIDGSGNIYIADDGNDLIHVF